MAKRALSLYPQEIPGTTAFLVADRQSLQELRLAIDRALAGPFRCADLHFAPDVAGRPLPFVVVCASEEDFDQLAPPYQDRLFQKPGIKPAELPSVTRLMTRHEDTRAEERRRTRMKIPKVL